MPDPIDVPRDPEIAARERMVREQIERRGVSDPRVLAAMRRVPRHLFVPEALRDRAYEDGPLPIGEGQTISQPYIVAFMTEAIFPEPSSRVLEIGTGSGYQTAILASVAARVFTIEVRPELLDAARRRLADLGVANVAARSGDGAAGWPEEAPFDAVVVTAAPGEVPPLLLDQLGSGGRMIVPLGVDDQVLTRITRTEAGFDRRPLMAVRFVLMGGAAPRR
jgi:protein-L-isoaspartate(D-aspartate) O-methyltransferase